MMQAFGAHPESWSMKVEEPPVEDMSGESEVEPENEPSVGVLICTYPGCLKEFSTRWSLNRHTRVHTGVKPYKCNFCFKEFAQNCSLKRHEQTHSQERVWVCDYQGCGKRFKLKEYLEVHHQRTHFKEDAVEQPVITNLSEQSTNIAASASASEPNEIIEKLRERLVRMGLRHHDQLSMHQEREGELLVALREVAETLDDSLDLISKLTNGDMSIVPDRMKRVAQKYSPKGSTTAMNVDLIAKKMQASVPQPKAVREPLPAPMSAPLPGAMPPTMPMHMHQSFGAPPGFVGGGMFPSVNFNSAFNNNVNGMNMGLGMSGGMLFGGRTPDGYGGYPGPNTHNYRALSTAAMSMPLMSRAGNNVNAGNTGNSGNMDYVHYPSF